MTDTRRRAGRRCSAAAVLALILSACSTSEDAADDQPSSALDGPTAEWGEWIEVNELATPVGSTDDTVLLSGLGTSSIIALDRVTGEERWRVGADDPSADPSVSEAWQGGAVLFDDTHVYSQRASDDGVLVAHDMATGDESWSFDPGELDACAPTGGWRLSWSLTGSYAVGDSARLIMSHPQMADPGCHAGPNATHPGSPAMVALDADTGSVDGEPMRVSGTAIPGLSSPDLTGEYIDTPYQLQGSVNIVRRDIDTGEEHFAMLDYPDDLSALEVSPTITDMGDDRFHILYMNGDSVEVTVDRWAADFMDTGEVSARDLNHETPCEYRTQRSSSGLLYCLILTSSPDPSHTPAFEVGEVDATTGTLRDGHPVEFPSVLMGDNYVGDEYYGVVTDPQTVENDALIPPEMTGAENSAAVLPSEEGLSAFDLGSGSPRWTWSSGSGGAAGPHVVQGVDEVVLGLDGTAVGLDVHSGEELWEEQTNGPVFGVGDVIVIADYETSTTLVRTTLPLG